MRDASDVQARLNALYAERARSRAELCECGHVRFAHFERVAGCLNCKCCSFSMPRDAADKERS